MALRQGVRLELDDGTVVEVVYNGRDLRAWESAHEKSALVERMSVSMLTWLGWHAAVRTGKLTGDLAEWRKFDRECVDVEGYRPDAVEEVDDAPGEAPTRPARGGG